MLLAPSGRCPHTKNRIPHSDRLTSVRNGLMFRRNSVAQALIAPVSGSRRQSGHHQRAFHFWALLSTRNQFHLPADLHLHTRPQLVSGRPRASRRVSLSFLGFVHSRSGPGLAEPYKWPLLHSNTVLPKRPSPQGWRRSLRHHRPQIGIPHGSLYQGEDMTIYCPSRIRILSSSSLGWSELKCFSHRRLRHEQGLAL